MKGFRLSSWIYLGLILGIPLATLIWHFPGIKLEIKTFFSKSFYNSVLIAFGTAFFSFILGSIAGFILAKIPIPGSKIWPVLLVAPVFFVPYQMALGWDAFLSSKLNSLLFSPIGVIWVLTGCFYPVVFWFALIAFKIVPPEEEEAGLLIARPFNVLMGITLPKVFPALLTGTFLVFILAFTELGVPTYLGVSVLPYEVLIQFSSLYDFKAAVSASWPMVCLGILILFLEYRFFKKTHLFYQKATEPKGLIFSPPIKTKIICFFFLLGLIFLFLMLPIGALFKEASSLSAIKFAIKNGIFSLGRGIFYSVLAGILAATWALITFYSGKGKGHPLMSGISLTGLFLSPAVLAAGMIYFWSQGPFTFLYRSFMFLIFGYLARFSFFAYRSLETAFEHLDLSSWEASLFTGHSSLTILRCIIFPQVRKWFFLSLILIFIFSINELGISTMLYPPQGAPPVVRLYTLSVNNPLSYSAALALLYSTGTLLGAAILYYWGIK